MKSQRTTHLKYAVPLILWLMLQEPIMQSSTGTPNQFGATTLAEELHLASLPYACAQHKAASPSFLCYDTLDAADSTGEASARSFRQGPCVAFDVGVSQILQWNHVVHSRAMSLSFSCTTAHAG